MAVSLEQFAGNLIQSGLFSAAELAAFQESLPVEKRPRDAQGLARELNRAGKLTKYQAGQVYQGKRKGLVLGDYVILDEIGHGGMGQVFKAWRREMERTVALKILPAKRVASRESVERFRREVKAGAKLEHPNIVTAYDAGEAEGIYFLVMQYIEGQDLAHVVAAEKGGQVRFSSGPDAAERHDEPTKSEPVPLFQSYLILDWPEADRADAQLLIDDLTYDLSGPQVQSASDEIKIALRPGSHKVWIVRRGFEPIEEHFQAIAGEEHTLRADWRVSPGLAEQVEEQPEPASPTPAPTPTPTPKASDVAESAQPGEPGPMEPETPEPNQEAEKRLAAEARYAEAMKPIDDLIAAWNFREASAALAKLQFPEQDLAARLAAWRAGVARLVDLKARIITKINTADPPLKTTALLIRGAGRDLVKAEENGLTTKLRSGKPQLLPWPDVGPQAIEKLIELARAQPTRGLAPFSAQTKKVPVPLPKSADRLAAGVLALASKDPTSAEKHFERADALGVEIGPYLAPLAASAFSEATGLSDAKKFSDAVAAIEDIKKTYAEIPWFKANKKAFAAALAKAQAGLYEHEAEQLYAEAAEFFGKEQLFDVRPIVQKLKTEYPDSPAATDDGREPSFATMEQSIAGLGQFITVRLDGQGDFTTIQAAIDAAVPNSLVEIRDNGPYFEKLSVPEKKDRLTIRGQSACWPLIISDAGARDCENLVEVASDRLSLERMALVHMTPKEEKPSCLAVVNTGGAVITFRDVLFFIPYGSCVQGARPPAGKFHNYASFSFYNCLLVGGLSPNNTNGFALDGCVVRKEIQIEGRSKVLRSTLLGVVTVGKAGCEMVDSIVGSVTFYVACRVEHCNLITSQRMENIVSGKGCISVPAGFRDPANLDYRLMPTSPCIGKASDGGDIGCQYTPEMIEMCQKALELRAKGIIKF